MPPQRICFGGVFGLKMGIHFAHFGLESGMVFESATGAYECSYLFRFQMPNVKNEIEICEVEMHLKSYFVCALI